VCYWFNTPTLWFDDHFVVFPTFSSLSVWPESYPFFCFDPFSEPFLKTLPSYFRNRVSLLRFSSLQRFGRRMVSVYPGVASPRKVALLRSGYRLNAFPLLQPWDLFSYPNALEIFPLEFFPLWRCAAFLNNLILSLCWLNIRDRVFKARFNKKPHIQSFGLQRIRTYLVEFYSSQIADTLLGFSPFRVCPGTVMERISPFFLSLACITKLPKQSRNPAIQSFASRSGCPSPKRWHPLLGFLTSSVFWQSKVNLVLDYLILLGALVVITDSIYSSLNQASLSHLWLSP
jgi:hypothetical protein